MTNEEKHRVKRDLQVSNIFSFCSGAALFIGINWLKAGTNKLSVLAFLGFLVFLVIALLVSSRIEEEEDG